MDFASTSFKLHLSADAEKQRASSGRENWSVSDIYKKNFSDTLDCNQLHSLKQTSYS